MDLVYILGTGSVCEDYEIRFSLRSVEKNLLDLGRIFIIGERPAWLKNIIHIPAPDSYSAKWRNSYSKTILACKDPRPTEEFLFMNDDFFLIKPIVAADFPYYYNKNFPRQYMLNHALVSAIKENRKKSGKNFDFELRNFGVHRPVRYNKNLYLKMPILYPDSLSFSPRAFYCNYYGVQGLGCQDPLLFPGQSVEKIDFFTSDLTDFSIHSDTAKCPNFRTWLVKQFPEPSRFEE